jgi:methylmalonyl-CoA mutase
MDALFTEFSEAPYSEWVTRFKKELEASKHTVDVHKQLEDNFISAYNTKDNSIPTLNISALKQRKNPQFYNAYDWIKECRTDTSDLLKSNKKALKALNLGAEAITFEGIGISNQSELTLVLNGILPEIASLNFSSGEAAPAILFMLCDEFSRRNLNRENLKGSVEFDILGTFAAQGTFALGKSDSFNILAEMLKKSHQEIPNYRNLVVNATLFHESGALSSQELTFFLLEFKEYFDVLGQGVSPEILLRNARLRLASGSDYFLNMAKFRSARLLWHMLLEAYGYNSEIYPLEIAGETALRNKSQLGSQNNLLRLTAEAMSSVIGGTDSFYIHPFDYFIETPDADSWRLSLNIQHLLKHEAHFDRVIDPASGSWFLDDLTQKLTEKSWQHFHELSDKGSFSELIAKGIIQAEIQRSATDCIASSKMRKRVTVGANKYGTVESRISIWNAEIDPLINPSEVETLKPIRETEWMEHLRMRLRTKNITRSIIFSLGKSALVNAREKFAIEIIQTLGLEHLSLSIADASEISSLEHGPASDALLIFCADDLAYSDANLSQLIKYTSLNHIFIVARPNTLTNINNTGSFSLLFIGCDIENTFNALLN